MFDIVNYMSNLETSLVNIIIMMLYIFNIDCPLSLPAQHISKARDHPSVLLGKGASSEYMLAQSHHKSATAMVKMCFPLKVMENSRPPSFLMGKVSKPMSLQNGP